MSTTLDKQVKGSNFCWMDCSEKKAVIHPETCVKQVKITDNSDSTLEDWILRTSNDDEITDSMSSYTGLLNWLQTNYPVSGGSSTVTPATPTTLGVIKTGEGNRYLNLNSGVLTLNVDNLPEATIPQASVTESGTIKLGTSTTIANTFPFNTASLSNVSFPQAGSDDDCYAFPLTTDNNNCTGIVIPKRLFNPINLQSQTEQKVIYIINKNELGVNTYSNYFGKLFESEAYLSLNSTRTISINIINSFDTVDTDNNDDSTILAGIFNILIDEFKQHFDGKDDTFNTKISVSFTVNGQLTLPIFINKVTGTYTNLEVERNDNAGYDDNSNTWSLSCPPDKKCTVTIQYNNTKATLNPNEVYKIYSSIFSFKVEDYYQANNYSIQ